MIRTLQKRVPKYDPTYREWCPGCNSLIEFQQSDAHFRTEGRSAFLEVECPECGVAILHYPKPPATPAPPPSFPRDDKSWPWTRQDYTLQSKEYRVGP